MGIGEFSAMGDRVKPVFFQQLNFLTQANPGICFNVYYLWVLRAQGPPRAKNRGLIPHDLEYTFVTSRR